MPEKKQQTDLEAIIQGLKNMGIQLNPGRKVEIVTQNEFDDVSGQYVTRQYVHIEKADETQGPLIPLDKIVL